MNFKSWFEAGEIQTATLMSGAGAGGGVFDYLGQTLRLPRKRSRTRPLGQLGSKSVLRGDRASNANVEPANGIDGSSQIWAT